MKRNFPKSLVYACLWITWMLLQPGQVTTAALGDSDTGGIDQLLHSYASAVAGESMAGIMELVSGSSQGPLRDYWTRVFSRYRDLRLNQVPAIVGTSGDSALVRTEFVLTGRTSELNAPRQPQTIDRGIIDFLLRRDGTHWRFTAQQWNGVDIGAEVRQAVEQEDRPQYPRVLHFVVAHAGGQWFPLRQMRWEGRVASPAVPPSGRFSADITDALEQVVGEGAECNRPMNAHLFVQWNGEAWLVAATEWDSLRLSRSVSHTAEDTAEMQARRLREAVEGSFGDAGLHRDYATTLAQLGLYAKSLEELQKAKGLQPSMIADSELCEAEHLVERDPLRMASDRIQFEGAVGVSPLHPRLLLHESLSRYGEASSDPAECLQRSLWCLRLGDDKRAESEWSRAQVLMRSIRSAAVKDALRASSANVQRCIANSRRKPPALLRSDLFTVRARHDNPSLPQLLAALEYAQHNTYSDFGIPMKQTEVVLFPTQGEFQKFASIAAESPISEFAAAYTDGEEIVTYVQSDKDTFSVVAHEYGHVAIKTITDGALIPDWLNEGIACVVQGGYWDYQKRVSEAWQRNQLNSIPQLLAWNFEGEDSFLAYSQANSMVEFLLKQAGKQALLSILRDLGRGMTADHAFIKGLKVNQQQFLTAWLRSLAGGDR